MPQQKHISIIHYQYVKDDLDVLYELFLGELVQGSQACFSTTSATQEGILEWAKSRGWGDDVTIVREELIFPADNPNWSIQ